MMLQEPGDFFAEAAVVDEQTARVRRSIVLDGNEIAVAGLDSGRFYADENADLAVRPIRGFYRRPPHRGPARRAAIGHERMSPKLHQDLADR